MRNVLSVLAVISACTAEILSEEFIYSINNKQATWTAGRNFPEDTPTEVLKRLAGTFLPNNTNVPTKFHDVVTDDIPDTFDSRDYWPQCESIREIRNQGACGSCWAFATAATMTDRICIASNGAQKFKFSSNHLLSCCSECGSCDGGYMDKAWSYYVESGVVSGGDYNSSEGCQPYDICAYSEGKTPNCSTNCLNQNYIISFNQDKHFGHKYYAVGGDVQQIQTEIMKHGPVETFMHVYGDFYNYKSGVYSYTAGDNPGGHAVKIIGWGTENNTPYWLVANSWGKGWGSLGGFFKIIRGQNNCRIEEWVFAGIPTL